MVRRFVLRTPSAYGLYVVTLSAFLVAACRPGDDGWPAALPDDEGDVVYAVRVAANGAEVVAVSAAGVRPLGLAADAASAVALAPDGVSLYYARDGALRRFSLITARDDVVASFPAGEARELPVEGKDKDQVHVWRCGYRFRDIAFGAQDRITFLLEPAHCPLPDEKRRDFTPAEINGWRPRGAFAADAGAYLLPRGGGLQYLGPTRAVYGFAGDDVILENKLTAVRYNLKTGGGTPLLAKGAHEVGWLPAAAVSADKVVVVGAKAKEGSSTTVLNRIYVITARSAARKPVFEIVARTPTTRAALSPDGCWLALELTPPRAGPSEIYVVDLARKRYRRLATGARLLRFARGGAAVFYVSAPGRTGDLYLGGLDGRTRRLTTSVDFLPPP